MPVVLLGGCLLSDLGITVWILKENKPETKRQKLYCLGIWVKVERPPYARIVNKGAFALDHDMAMDCCFHIKIAIDILVNTKLRPA